MATSLPLLFVYAYIYTYMCTCICMCVYICTYTESECEYICIDLMNLTGAKSLLKKIKGLYSKTPISQGRVYLERIRSLQGAEV